MDQTATSPTPHSDSVLVLCRDLIFSSRIVATARADGVVVKLLRDPAALESESASRAIVDLNQPGVLEAAEIWKRRDPTREVMGFVSHVDAETIRRAREAGIEAIPRSRFVELLPQLLRGRR